MVELVPTWWQCHQRWEPKGQRWDEYSEAWMELFKLQPFSVAYSHEVEGWSIERVTKDGTIVTDRLEYQGGT